jgi:hypothetical protein
MLLLKYSQLKNKYNNLLPKYQPQRDSPVPTMIRDKIPN